jgi:N-acetylmuramoyl-L-alanine amidase
MTLACCRARISLVFSCLIILMPFLLQASPVRQWDVKGASRTFEEAGKKQNAINQATQPALSQYLECAKAYRKVYILDPHYRYAGAAIYKEALLYQEMGDKFNNLEHYKIAAKRFNMLITNYEGHQNCPDALMRMASIYSNQLKNEAASQNAYKRLRTRYPSSYDSMRKASSAINQSDALQETMKNSSMTAGVAGLVSVQNIRYWFNPDYTRVVLDLDSDAIYKKEKLTNPDRIYFDISNARINKDLVHRTISVGDDYLKQVRVAPCQINAIRVVFDVSKGVDSSISELHNPFRIIIDLRGPGPRTTLTPLPQASTPRPDEVFSTPASKQASAEGKPGKAIRDTKSSLLPKPSNSAASPSSLNAANSPSPASNQATSQINERVAQSESQVTSLSSIADPKRQGPPRSVASLGNTADTPLGFVLPNDGKSKSKNTDSKVKSSATKGLEVTAVPKVAPATHHGDHTLTRVLGLKISRIVIDPGHGGHDQGTNGPGGMLEKTLVLSLAHTLKTMLEERMGAEVFLTRDDDTFISLEERTSLANQHHADLFVSIHANSSRIRSISGVETYYLDFAKTDAEREIAARENATSDKNVSDLEDLIKKIAKADKSAESRELASLVQQKLYSGSKKLLPSTHNRGVRRAPFVVLIGASMPSVLAEVAFISNPKDEKLLGKKANQDALAKALFAGIEGYVNTLGSETLPNQQASKNK